MSRERLEPCPFCGGEAGVRESVDGAILIVGCLSCACCIGLKRRDEAAAAWNTRTPRGSEDDVERVARAIFPNEWEHIDRRREAAKCYRETPHEQGGFESRESADAFAAEYEATADKLAEWILFRARAAIAAMPHLSAVREGVLEAEELRAAREIAVIVERRASAGDDRIRRLEGAIQAMAAAIRPLREQGEDYIWRPAARVLEIADAAILDQAFAGEKGGG